MEVRTRHVVSFLASPVLEIIGAIIRAMNRTGTSVDAMPVLRVDAIVSPHSHQEK